MSSTCFETEGSSSGRRLCTQLWYGTFLHSEITIYFFFCNFGVLKVHYHNCKYNRLPEDEPSVSKYVENFKIKN